MNYLSYYNLRSEPFSNAPLSEFYFDSRQHTDALKRLLHVARNMKGLAVLVGDVGRGKSTLARHLLEALPEDEFEAAMLVVVHAAADPKWLLRRLATQLGVSAPAEEPLAIISQLYERLVQIHQTGKRTVVLIDEAQMLGTREMMEEFRGLLNLEVPGHKLITFVFFGLPELEQNLKLDPPLAQRVALRYQLSALAPEETADYVNHRLRVAGATELLFDSEALWQVHRYTGGVPRVINTLCDNVLLEMFFAHATCADATRVMEAAGNLKMIPDAILPTAAPMRLPVMVTAPATASALNLEELTLEPVEDEAPDAPPALMQFPPRSVEAELDRQKSESPDAGDDLPSIDIEVDQGLHSFAGQAPMAPTLSDEADSIAALVAADVMNPPGADETVDLPGNQWDGVQAGDFLGNVPSLSGAPPPELVPAPAAAAGPKKPVGHATAITPPGRPASTTTPTAAQDAKSRVEARTRDILADVDDLLNELKVERRR